MRVIEKNFENRYPNIAQWIQYGVIEIGFEYGRDIVARAINEGGVVWEGGNLKNLEKALESLDEGIKKWCDEITKSI